MILRAKKLAFQGLCREFPRLLLLSLIFLILSLLEPEFSRWLGGSAAPANMQRLGALLTTLYSASLALLRYGIAYVSLKVLGNRDYSLFDCGYCFEGGWRIFRFVILTYAPEWAFSSLSTALLLVTASAGTPGLVVSLLVVVLRAAYYVIMFLPPYLLLCSDRFAPWDAIRASAHRMKTYWWRYLLLVLSMLPGYLLAGLAFSRPYAALLPDLASYLPAWGVALGQWLQRLHPVFLAAYLFYFPYQQLQLARFAWDCIMERTH